MTLADGAALVVLMGLTAYAVLGGADFGGGLWYLFAAGPRAEAQRRVIDGAIAPVWEANHVWLIFALVVLFTAFPPAYALLLTALHVPVTLMLLGIVLRGAAFTFRHYDPDPAARRVWGRVFGVASLLTPIFLGVTLAAVTEGRIRMNGDVYVSGFFRFWMTPFAFAVGAFTLALFAFLAAVFLTLETEDELLRDDFRKRAIAAGVAVGLTAVAAAFTGGAGTLGFSQRLLGSWWSGYLQLGTMVAAAIVFVALFQRLFRLARVFAVVEAVLILGGWALAHYPFLITPDLTVHAAAAPDITLKLLFPVVAGGGVILIPALYYLMAVFKSDQRSRIGNRE